ncbi:hypothetical protein Rumeso_00645 [Rubellimicrobium mesophilum DSM 19309]|uniref:Uncharacterized protein n=1 Tax=Rubellimicrobium mesophilum DSM 19309 TaxID=442562 RepID=A0A017HUS7_9RHOB|nr:hypothetical protein Rumeso_00645 [Rubellimicrobium mesophilum DSM 19309]
MNAARDRGWDGLRQRGRATRAGAAQDPAGLQGTTLEWHGTGSGPWAAHTVRRLRRIGNGPPRLPARDRSRAREGCHLHGRA